MASDISPNPGWTRTCHSRKSPVFTSTRNSEFLSLNARSLMNHHTKNNTIISNMNCFQDLVYSENADLVEVCETLLNDNIEDLEFLHSGYNIFSEDDWMDKFNIFLNQICNCYDSMLILCDFNLPKIPRDSPCNPSGVSEVRFVDLLKDHFLTQTNKLPMRENNVLDLIISSNPQSVTTTEVLSARKCRNLL